MKVATVKEVLSASQKGSNAFDQELRQRLGSTENSDGEVEERLPRSVSRRARESFTALASPTKDVIHHHQKRQTGLLEDLHLTLLSGIELVADGARLAVHRLFSVSLLQWLNPAFYWTLCGYAWEFLKSIRASQLRIRVVEQLSVDDRTIREMVENAGYPYEKYDVITSDGYVIQLDRIPRKDSRKVVLLQHGVMDSSFGWLSNGTASLGFRLADLGYDVFLGNFRGTGLRLHINPGLLPKDYWDYSVNEHAWSDLPAFIDQIRTVKHSDLGDWDFELSLVAHSMGAAASLMYLVKQGLDQQPTHLARAILLSPAGYHESAPLFARLISPLFDYWPSLPLRHLLYGFYLPASWLRVWTAKAMQDVHNNSAAEGLLGFLVSKVVGGPPAQHPVTTVHNLAYNTLPGTSAKIAVHFRQIYRTGRFQAFDYGPAENMRHYGQAEPLQFMPHYDAIHIPVHFLFGLEDSLIPPVNVLKHYTTLHLVHPELAHIKPCKGGHISFTVGMDDTITAYVSEALGQSEERSEPDRYPQPLD